VFYIATIANIPCKDAASLVLDDTMTTAGSPLLEDLRAIKTTAINRVCFHAHVCGPG